jgi:hypothetical protein
VEFLTGSQTVEFLTGSPRHQSVDIKFSKAEKIALYDFLF